MKNKRLSDQILIMQSIECVREELTVAHEQGANSIEISDILLRLTSLYACINTNQVADALKQLDTRSKYGKN